MPLSPVSSYAHVSMSNAATPKIILLTSDIGRGHPFYLDGIAESWQASDRLPIWYTSVFRECKGRSLAAWRLVRWLYVQGASNPFIKRPYQLLRHSNDYNQRSAMLNLLGSDLQKQFSNSDVPLVVDHPVLVAALRGRKNLIYQHGELVVPKEALVQGASYVLVPTESAARQFHGAGYSASQIIVTGLCIEPEMAKAGESTYNERVNRLCRKSPLTIAFFSSGAEPRDHIVALSAAIRSCIESGHRAIIIARHNGKLARKSTSLIQNENGSLLCTYQTRAELDRITAEHFPHFDCFAAPSHERSNWALGLGLPMFIVDPAIGTFAPLNRELLLAADVAMPIEDAENPKPCGDLLHELRDSGKLAQMAHAGWGREPIDGFAHICSFLATLCR